MVNKRPSEAVVRLWAARVEVEQARGTSLQETHVILSEMIAGWEAVEERAAKAK
ncbi:hypothetical protein LJR098_002105 [Rhizobium sp. LjRoot98]|uniref:hypothetical protein n=1 Tax=unclassified Rhizobium TaxID=2613769 RepID=UPI000A7E5A10|nr:hypothetical protein [Rhizobium sp. Root1204]